MSKKRLLTAAGLFGICTRFPFHLIHSEPIATAKIRFFTQETEYLHWKLQDKQWANTALSFNKGIFCCCKRCRRNQQRKQKTRKCASDMKTPKNVDVLTKTAKRNALWFFSDFLSKVKCGNYVFCYFRQNGTFFRKMAFAAMFFRFFCVFRC